MKRVAVKIGSNVLTRPDGSLDITRMSAIVDQVAQLHRDGVEVIMVSSGAVASGRSEMKGHLSGNRMDSVDQRQLFSAVGQAKLINRYYELFREHRIVCGQVLTMKESFATRVHYLNQRNCMNVMLAEGVVPIVNENDTVSVTELMFTDNDELSGLIASMMDCDALIILSNIDGIYTGMPGSEGAEVIRLVTPDMDLEQYIGAEKSGFGRGGMKTKYGVARRVADEGIEVVIANGKRDGVILRLVKGDSDVVCTRFLPREAGVSSMKRWIANSTGFAKGSVTIDAEAARRIASADAVSLLPVGVTCVEGSWEKDDLIRIVGPDGEAVGVGRAAFSSNEAAAMAGKHDCKPLVHYDYLYID